jgi:hypothetical protein
MYCDLPFPERIVGDHVIPQSLGKLCPELVLKCVCEKCDNGNGAFIEKVMARGGLIGWFRLINRIKSENNKGKPAYNPLIDPRFGYKTNFFDVYQVDEKTGERIRPYVLPNGTLYSPLTIDVLNEDGSVREVRSIDSALDAEGIAAFCLKVATEVKPRSIKYHVPEEINEAVHRAIITKGCKIISRQTEPKQRTLETFTIHAVFEEPYQRGVLNIALKAIVFSGCDRALLKPALAFAQKGEFPRNGVSIINKAASALNHSADNDISDHGHRFEWKFTHEHLYVNCFMLCKSDKHGMVSQFRFPLGESSALVVPTGVCIVKYLKTPTKRGEIGWIEVLRGGEVIASGRDREIEG